MTQLYPAHSRLGFTIGHLGIAEISGAFDKFEVTITSAEPGTIEIAAN